MKVGDKPASKRETIPITIIIGKVLFPIILQTRNGNEKSTVKCNRNNNIEVTKG